MRFEKVLLGITAVAVISIGCEVFADDSALTLKDMAAPISHPTSFEDPRSYTEIRPIFAYHKIDDDFITKGGSASVYALQLRYAIDDRLAIIATKDGFVDLKSDEVLDDNSGWADLSAGVKYAFYKDDQSRQIATVGLRYEIPVGEKEVFQGQGDGAFNPFLSAGFGIGRFNFMLGTGFRLALDDEDSSFYDLDLHLDTKLGIFHPLVEIGVYNVVDGGERLPIADEGEDFFNFGASEASGNTLVTAAVGTRIDLVENVSFGAAYEFPLSDGEGSNILDYRVTTDLSIRF